MTEAAQPDMFGAPDVGGARDALDRYFTPPWATRALVDYMGDRLTRGRVWEPCAGNGHIVDVLREAGCDVLASDILPGRDDIIRHDFMGQGPPAECSLIVTNFPYLTDLTAVRELVDGRVQWKLVTGDEKTAADFVQRALDVLPDDGTLACLLRLAFWEPCEDRAELYQQTPPTDYVVLPRVHYLGAPKNNNQTSVWFVFDKSKRTGAGGYVRVKHYSAAQCVRWGRGRK